MNIINILEASYAGNLGVEEMSKFFNVANDEQKKRMKTLLNLGKTQEAWVLLQRIVKTKLV